MRRSVLLLIATLVASIAATQPAICSPAMFLAQESVDGRQKPAADDPEALYRQRADLASAKRATELWQKPSATDYDAAWKLARAYY